MHRCTVCNKPLDNLRRATCSDDCHRARKREQNRQARQRAVERGCPPDMHGTVSGYTHYRCSCPKCTQWMREYKQHRRALSK